MNEVTSINCEWKRRIENSPEAKKAKLNLEYHRKKMRMMHEEISRAEVKIFKSFHILRGWGAHHICVISKLTAIHRILILYSLKT